MDNFPLGAKELLKTADGRRFLENEQKKHEIDLLQPGNPKFEKVYGEKIRKQEETRQRIAEESKSLYKEQAEKKAYDQYRKGHVNRKYL